MVNKADRYAPAVQKTILVVGLLWMTLLTPWLAWGREFIPAKYQTRSLCGSELEGETCLGWIIWDRASLYEESMDDFDRRFTFAHEAFHAVQFNYLKFREEWCRLDTDSRGSGGWLMEGMADAAAMDWAAGRTIPKKPAPGSDWRFDGHRFFSHALDYPQSGLAFYATSSFWHYLREVCGDYSLWQAVLEKNPRTAEKCPVVRGEPPKKVTAVKWSDHPVLIVDRVAEPVLGAEFDNFVDAFKTALGFYRAAGFEEPCLQLEDTTLSSKPAYVIRDANIPDDTGEAEQQSNTESIARPAGISYADAEILKLVDRNLSYFLTLMCTGGRDVKAESRSRYCRSYEEERAGGLTVAYLAFINQLSEDVISGKIPYEKELKAEKPEDIIDTPGKRLFKGGCQELKDGSVNLVIPELASVCVDLNALDSTEKDLEYNVIVSGPLSALGQLHLGWHGCYRAPWGTVADDLSKDPGKEGGEATGQKIWVLKPSLVRPGCIPRRGDYTLVFSNIARKAYETRAGVSVLVRIEKLVEGDFDFGS